MKTQLKFTAFAILLASLLAFGLAFGPVHSVQAASCTVTSAADSGAGSLRALLAVKGKNACTAINFNSDMTIALASPLVLSGSVTIDGTGRAVTISGDSNGDGTGETYLFDVPEKISAHFQHLTFEKGAVGKLDPWGYLAGGAIYNAGMVWVTDSTFSGNSATTYGGAISNLGTLEVKASTFSGNSAKNGGAIRNAYYSSLPGILTVTNSTFTGNQSTSGNGGALINVTGTVTVVNSTFVGNSATTSSATAYGGGIYNVAGTATVLNSILFQNTAKGTDILHTDCYGAFTSDSSRNLSDDPTCPATSWRSSYPPNQVGPLGSYGGPTQTFPPLPGSSAIDSADSAYCPAVDQRGVARPQGGSCDIGAFESQGFNLAAASGSDQLAPLNTAFTQPLVATVSSAYGEPVDGGWVTFTAPPSGASMNLAVNAAIISGGQASLSVTANGANGGYAVVASAAGAPSASFSLVNGCWDNPLVTSDLDSGPGSLRQAIAWACPGDTITFASDTTVHLASELDLIQDVTIDGAEHSVVISGDNDGDGAGETNLFYVSSGINASFQHLTFEKGAIGKEFYDLGSNVFIGGAIFNDGTASVIDSTFTGNSANEQAGAIFNLGTMDVTGSTFTGNTSQAGGAMTNFNTMTVTNSTFSANSASLYGGGIFSAYGTLTVTNSTFSANSASSEGGAIYNQSTLDVTGSTFSGNIASRFGGALYQSGGSAQFTNDTFVGNFANNYFGGTYYVGGGSLALTNNIISSNVQLTCYSVSPSDLSGSNNLNNYGCTSSISIPYYLPGRIFSGSPLDSSLLLGPLGDNGGPTQTFALLPGSPAIDAGDDSACPATDQRGVARPIGAHCDIGALESPLLSTITVTSGADDGSGSLRHAILGLAPGGTITFAGDTTIHLASHLILSQDVTIHGGAHSVVISGDNTVQLFLVNAGVTAVLQNLTLENSHTAGDGGAINNAGSLTVSGSTFSSNQSDQNGGAIYNTGTLTVTNSTFSGNSAIDWGGAIYSQSTLEVTSSTFSGNNAGRVGGGIYSPSYVTTINNSILANNGGGNCAPQSANQSANLADDTSCGTSGFSVSSSILLDPLGSYGGGTQTFALLPGSPAIDSGNPSYCPATDQRGLPRVGACDIGAFESQGFSLAVSGGDNQAAFPGAAFANPLEVTVSSASGEPVDGGQVTFSAPADGASAALSGSPAVISNGKASVTATANATPGSYAVSAGARGGLNPVHFSLANVLAPAAVSLSSSLNPANYGDAVTFTASVTGGSGVPTGTVNFAIDSLPNDVPLAADGTASFTTSSLSGGLYTIVATYSGDATYASSASVPHRQVINMVPVVTQQPTDQAVTEGNPVSFSAAADGYPTPSVQWQESRDNGAIWANLDGATAIPLIFSASASQNGYQYRVYFGNDFGETVSAPATLTVQQLPTITHQPADLTVDEGSQASFGAAADSSLLLTVQWQVSSDNGASWVDIPHAVSIPLTFTASYSQNGTQYRAIFSNAAGSVASNPATLTVNMVSGTGSISGLVFNDLNGNGIKDRSEKGLVGWTVQLMDENGNLLQSVQTDGTGKYNYSFTALSSHVFRVRLAQPLPAGYVQTTADPADIALADGQAVTGVNFGAVVSADLKVSLENSISGSTITYTIIATNDGPAEAAAATLKDTLSRYVSFGSATSTLGSCSNKNGVVTCSFGTLASGQSATVTITVTRTSTKYAITNTASVSASVFDIDKADNSATNTIP